MTPEERNSRYLDIIRKQKEKLLNTPSSSPEEMYRLAQNSITSSLSPDEIKNAQSIVDNKVKRDSGSRKIVLKTTPNYRGVPENIIKTIPSEGNRTVEFRYNPLQENYEIAATDIFPVPESEHSSRFRELFPDTPPDMPRRQDIANLRINPKGKVDMIYSTPTGAREGAADRLLMEALKHDFSPHSDNLTSAGKKLVARKALELQNTPKEDMLNKFSKFLNTGKTGKLWSAVAPYIGPAGTALTAGAILASPNPAEAAMMEGVEKLVPGGVSDLGVADERSIPDPKYQDYIKRMSQRKK